MPCKTDDFDISMFFGFNAKVLGPKENKLIPDDFPGPIDGIVSNGSHIALFSNNKSSIFLISIDNPDWKRLNIPSDGQKVQFRNVLWYDNNTKIIAVLRSAIYIIDIETGNVVTKNGIENENNFYVDAITKDGLIYVLHSQNTLRIFNNDLEKVKDHDLITEPTAFYIFENIIAIGFKNGRVILYENNEEFTKVNEFRASSCPIDLIQMDPEQLYVSSRSDNIIWNRNLVPMCAIKSATPNVYPDPTNKYGISLYQAKLYFHTLKKGAKAETSTVVMKVDPDIQRESDRNDAEPRLREKPVIEWINENKLRVIIAGQRTVWIVLFERQV